MQEREQHEEDHGGILQGQFVLIFLDLMEMIHLDGYIKPINFSIFIELNILKCCYLLPFTLRPRPWYGNKIYMESSGFLPTWEVFTQACIVGHVWAIFL